MGRCLLKRICIPPLTIGVVVLAQVADMVVRTGGVEEVGKVDGPVAGVVGTEFHDLLRDTSTPRTLSSMGM